MILVLIKMNLEYSLIFCDAQTSERESEKRRQSKLEREREREKKIK